jgi:hypothetical protein
MLWKWIICVLSVPAVPTPISSYLSMNSAGPPLTPILWLERVKSEGMYFLLVSSDDISLNGSVQVIFLCDHPSRIMDRESYLIYNIPTFTQSAHK